MTPPQRPRWNQFIIHSFMSRSPHEEDEVQVRGKAGQLFPSLDEDQGFKMEEIFYPSENTFHGHEEKPFLHNPHQRTPQKAKLMASVNLVKSAAIPRGVSPALSKPSFCPTNSDFFVCGTEEQDNYKKNGNMMIFSQIQGNNVLVRSTQAIPDAVRDIQWFDPYRIVFAINHKLGLFVMTPEFNVESVVMFPEFHKDAVREICISEGNKNLVISGGFDGNVFVTDITRLVSDIEKNEKKSENSLYPCRDVVGSVSWHPSDSFLASCTTDTGTLHIFDIRTDKRRPAIVHDSGKKELYCHAYQDTNSMLLGFGDGTLQSFDVRTKKTVSTLKDPYQRSIGEIRFDFKSRSFATFGVPSVSMWHYDDHDRQPVDYHQTSDSTTIPNFKTSGDFKKGTGMLGCTDSSGMFTLYAF